MYRVLLASQSREHETRSPLEWIYSFHCFVRGSITRNQILDVLFLFNLLRLSPAPWAASVPLCPLRWHSALCRSSQQLCDKDTPTPAREDEKYNRANRLSASTLRQCLRRKSVLCVWWDNWLFRYHLARVRCDLRIRLCCSKKQAGQDSKIQFMFYVLIGQMVSSWFLPLHWNQVTKEHVKILVPKWFIWKYQKVKSDEVRCTGKSRATDNEKINSNNKSVDLLHIYIIYIHLC